MGHVQTEHLTCPSRRPGAAALRRCATLLARAGRSALTFS
ncbi:hypothetical protein HMPREF9622_02795 [Cutibacterium modestum HL037PA3]|nr:hypothetical protein HMPREF9622_02795 [Cutibacterium modestum HL037PA3]